LSLAPLPHDTAPSQAARTGLDGPLAVVASEMEKVNSLILDRLQSEVSLIPELARHLIAAGGKRIRPVLTLLAAKMCGYEGERHVALAACVEFIHTATLLHDDVVDESDLRRGRSTANAVWGNKAPVLVGDFLFSRAFMMMVGDGSMRVLEILSRASAVIAEGEVEQLVTANDTGTTEAAYLHMIASKTAALFEAAAQVGAVLASRPEADEQALATYGRSVGVAFQLIDDALDYGAGHASLGKTVGDDFREGKITLPVLLAFARADEEERGFWKRCLERMEQEDGDLEHAIRLMEKHGAIRDTITRAEAYSSEARAALEGFADSRARRSLLELADFAVHRAF
jgi:octaprenyl-diphosphate synthase